MGVEKYRLLLVDDDPSVIHVLNRMLGATHDLRYALSGETALAIAREWLPDAVLLDAQMPGMTGTEVCRHFKADDKLKGVPVIFVTSLGAAGAELMTLELGAAGLVGKPLNEAELLATIDQVLQGQPRLAPLPTPRAADGRPRILIVDDDPSAIRTIHAALADLDAHFFFGTSGEQALVLAREHHPDVVLLDMYMPGLDGLQTLKALKSDPALADAQVLVVTRFGHPEMETRALDSGAVDFVAKPYTQAVLKARVGNVLRLLEHTRLQRQTEREHWQRIGNNRLARVVAAATDAIVTADAQGHIVLINASACQMFGVDAALTIGQALSALLPGVKLGTQEAVQRSRLRIKGALGREFPVEMSYSVLAYGDEQLTTLVLRDLSDAERAQNEERAKLQAQTALQAKTMMLSYVAHEIGNPLSSIIGMTKLLQGGLKPGKNFDKERLLKLLGESGDHLNALMRDVLDIHRLEAGRFDLDLSATDAELAAARALDAVRGQAQQAGVNLVLQAPEAPLLLLADTTRLHQCLVNLLSNGIKYGGSAGPLVIRCCAAAVGPEVQLQVQDQGAGLSAEQQASLFQPFNRLGRTTGAGAGVGLALTRMLALAMNGSLTVHSAPGQGCCFTLSLPLAQT